MSERVKLEVTLQTVRNGETQNTRVLIACLVGDTESNILSTGSLVKNGWAIQMSSEEFSMKHSSGLECQLIEWGGCRWISCKGVGFRGITSSNGELNVVRYGLQPDELHRARGHMPYDPSCKHCVAAKPVEPGLGRWDHHGVAFRFLFHWQREVFGCCRSIFTHVWSIVDVPQL